MIIFEYFNSLPFGVRIVLIPAIAVIAHFIVRVIRGATQWLLTRNMAAKVSTQENFTRRFPKFASIITILISALTFTIYFLAVGLILREFKISLATYLASATVLGLAIGFGLQGFVQDVVIGLTLIFTDTLNIEDVVEISGQIGRVEKISLRFTTLINLHGQKIYIPNRNIAVIGRFKGGALRVYVDVQLSDDLEEKKVMEAVEALAKGMYQQHKGIILNAPEIFGIKEARAGQWRYLRVKFRIWPGQNALIETTFKQRVSALMKGFKLEYADWMITVTNRVE
jgi:moderate conductance mechanosensitive channel